MALAVVHSAQGSGTSLSITTPAAGNLLVVFASQNSASTAPTITDSASGTYSVNATHAVYAGGGSLYVGYKFATGTETTVSMTPGSGGTGTGVVCFEVSGSANPIVVEAITHTDNSIFASNVVTTAITTTQSDLLLAVVSLAAAQPTQAWSGTKVLTSISIGQTTSIFGGYIATGALTSQTFQANWNGSRNSGNIVIALEAPYVVPTSGGFLSFM